MKIGDKIYKYLSFNGFGSYLVIAEIKREKAMLYEVECQACQHGYKCRLLVSKKRGENIYIFAGMTNEEDEDYQECWHNDDLFYPNLEEARKAKYIKAISEKEKEIKKQEETLIRIRLELEELKQHYSNISPT